jgi:endoglucanase
MSGRTGFAAGQSWASDNQQGNETPGIWRPSMQWHLRNRHSPGGADITPFLFGVSGDKGLVGDWDGDGIRTAGVWRVQGGLIWWYLSNSHNGATWLSFPFGQYGGGYYDVPVVGDWDGDGHDSVGITRVVNGQLQWHLKNTLDAGAAPIVRYYGALTDSAIPGDWDGDGDDMLGIWRLSGGVIQWHLRNDLEEGGAQIVVNYGQWAPTWDRPIAGDWNGDGTHTLGIVRDTAVYLQWHLKECLCPGAAPSPYYYGQVSTQDREVRGDWDNQSLPP